MITFDSYANKIAQVNPTTPTSSPSTVGGRFTTWLSIHLGTHYVGEGDLQAALGRP
jgi:hypothetical protein